jgi:hypothetical protein
MVAGAGGALLIASLFLPWADTDGASRSGWELWTLADVLFLIVGSFAVGTAITGGRFGVFRPDVSLIGATDLLSVLSTILLGWLLIFDFPEGATGEIGAFLALIAVAAVACGVGDYRVFRGAPLFPKTTSEP